MKKDIIIRFIVFIAVVFILSSIVFAERGSGKDVDEREKIKVDNRDKKVEEKKRIIDEEGNEREVRIRIEEKEENGRIVRRFRVKAIEAHSKLDIREETIGNISRIRVKLSTGRDQEIKIMPDEAASRAIEILKSLNFSIELREVALGNGSSQVIYFIEANKTGRFLGLIKTKIKLDVEIDSETGEIIRIRKKWWSFLVRGEDDDETNGKVILCHIPPGNPADAHTIEVGAPAMRAHLAHGDTLGACEPSGNETSPPQNNTQPPQNTTGQNITVNVNAGIGVNPSS